MVNEEYFEVNEDLIKQLGPKNLVDLVRKLLSLELQGINAANPQILIPENINASDGGEDGYVQFDRNGRENDMLLGNTSWQVGHSRFLFQGKICLQMKASHMGPSDCIKEVVKNGEIKPGILSRLQNGAGYMLISNKTHVSSEQIRTREEKILTAFKDNGLPDLQRERVKFMGATELVNWVNMYVSAVSWVRTVLGMRSLVFAPWGKIPKSKNMIYVDKEGFIRTPRIKDQIDVLKNLPSSTHKAIVRLFGLSGVGKTQLVREAFRGKPSEWKNRSDRVLYFDAGFNEDQSVLLSEMKEIVERYSNCSYIIIVDNCSRKLHGNLEELIPINDSKVLITIGHQDIESTNCRSMHINHKEGGRLVHQILEKHLLEQINGEQIALLSDFCGGFPFLAEAAISQIKKSASGQIALEIKEDLFFEKLINIDGVELQDIVEVATLLSLFKRIGIKEQYSDQFESLITNQSLFCSIAWGGNQESKILGIKNRVIKKWRQKNLIEEQGRYISLGPKPLAIYYAKRWWKDADSGQIEALMQFIEKNHLEKEFCEQVEYLNLRGSDTNLVTQKLCGDRRSPLFNVEGLKKDLGSRIFHAVSLVSPGVALETIQRLLSDVEPGFVFHIKGFARSLLVRGLRRIALHAEYFLKAGKLMLHFAAHETERVFSNNSTATFLQFFQVRYSGTNASLPVRLKLIRYAFNIENEEYLRLGILALQYATTNRFTGEIPSGSSELINRPQGRVPGSDEIKEYWEVISDIYISEFDKHPDQKEQLKKALLKSISSLKIMGGLQLIEKALLFYCHELREGWHEANKHAKRLLSLDSEMNEESREILQKIQALTAPKSLQAQIIDTICSPVIIRNENTKVLGQVERENAKELAQKLAKGNDWLEHLNLLIFDHSRYAFLVGNILGRSWQGDWNGAIPEVIKMMESGEGASSDLINGIVSGLEERQFREMVFRTVLDSEKLKNLIFGLIANSKPTVEDFQFLVAACKNRNLFPGSWEAFYYQNRWEKLSNSEIFSILTDLRDQGEQEKWITLILVNSLIRFRESNSEDFIEIGLKWFAISGTILLARKYNNQLSTTWQEWAERMIANEGDDGVVFVAKEIGLYYAFSGKSEYFDPMVVEVYDKIMGVDYELSWNNLGPFLIGQPSDAFRIRFSSSSGFWSPIREVFSVAPTIFLKSLEESTLEDRLRMARILPLTIPGKPSEWHPFIKGLIDAFGHEEDLLDEISSNLHSFFIGGPFSKFFQTRIDLVSHLFSHPTEQVGKWARKERDYFARRKATSELEEEERGI